VWLLERRLSELLDLLIIAPCTGNTLGKLANGITDTAVTMAAKAHLRNDRPVVVAVALVTVLAPLDVGHRASSSLLGGRWMHELYHL